ncbi:MAG: hypothetical protein CMJ65_18240 [Planctomycetaceae bacterium]|nr:hypothetical protein [Planctomycetaceae bacterium]
MEPGFFFLLPASDRPLDAQSTGIAVQQRGSPQESVRFLASRSPQKTRISDPRVSFRGFGITFADYLWMDRPIHRQIAGERLGECFRKKPINTTHGRAAREGTGRVGHRHH